MRVVDFLHRWIGGLIGLVLALLGVTGAVLVWKEAWIGVPHARDALIANPAVLARATRALLPHPRGGESIIYANERFGLHQLRLPGGAGAYADQTGQVVERWSSQWQRPELWLFDLHHHLLTGDAGETLVGIAGLCCVAFVVTGAILWWRTRRTFRFRLLPKRLSRAAIVMQHRDLGIVVAPLLLVSSITGSALVFRPFALLTLTPFGHPGAALASLKPRKITSAPLAAAPPLSAILATARRRFPEARIRTLVMPKLEGDPIVVRMRGREEWLTNGRTILSFDAADGRLLAVRDAQTAPRAAAVFDTYFPVHAGRVGGLIWRLASTTSGLALGLLGTLTVWTFWFRRTRRKQKASAEPAQRARLLARR